jgi:hypothetical protein
MQSSRDVDRWQKPDAGFLKINTNDAFQVESLTGAIEVVIRDEHGAFSKAMAQQIPSVGYALMVEEEAWRDRIQLLDRCHNKRSFLRLIHSN